MSAKIFILPILFIVLNINIYAQHLITGKVCNSGHEALNGVLVTVGGQQQGVRTNREGNFKILTDSSSHIIRFTLPGMETLELPIAKQKVLNVIMNEEPITSRYNTSSLSTGASVQQKLKSIENMAFTKNKFSGTMQISEFVDYQTENYALVRETGFQSTGIEPLSTFSIDVDRAAYANIRRFINNGQLPPRDAVRIEEMINYFHYNYALPKDDEAFAVNSVYAECPWDSQHQLLYISIQGKQLIKSELAPANLVFLIDVSGSMQAINKLPLVKSSLKMLVENLRETDRIAIVTYAGAAQLILESTFARNKKQILEAIDGLKAGGSTAGADGLKLAYRVATSNFDIQYNNRVIMATDGDFNVGQSSDAEMVRLISEQGRHIISLTVLGFGMGNLKDNRLEMMANYGNGNYAYIDNSMEAFKSLTVEFGATLFTVASDVKVQVEFNPSRVKAYRQIGYENRQMNKQDFNNQKIDAGDLGAGQQVTVIYEIIPATSDEQVSPTDPLRYQQHTISYTHKNEVANIHLRYFNEALQKEESLQQVADSSLKSIEATPNDFRFAASVAMFGMLLFDSPYKGTTCYSTTEALAGSSFESGNEGYREEFIRLVNTAKMLGLSQP